MSSHRDDLSLQSEPRLISSSRRAFLRRGAAAGGFAAFLAACGNNDAEVFAGAEFTAPTSEDLDLGEAPTTTTEVTSEGSAVAAFPAGAELLVAFTYEFGVDEARNLENPYLASWIEDSEGNLVSMTSLWVMQDNNPDQRALRWLSRLREWSAISGDTTISSATRVPGEFVVSWDGTDDSGGLVPQGDYVLFIEGVRRGNRYSITSTPITIGDSPFSATMDANGEIVSASAELRI